jgi:MFS family permease
LEPTRKKKRSNWIWSVAPSNAGTNGFGTLLPLFVRQLGGNVIDYSLMSTLYNITVTISQGFWGIATDRLARRRLFFVIAYVGMAVAFTSMYLFPTLLWLTIGYGILGAVVTANVTAASLLVMETSEKKGWVSLFSMLALVSNLGAIIGLLGGIFWSTFLPLNGFILFCAACEAFSVLLTFRLVPEPELPLEASQLVSNPVGLFSRIYHATTDRLNLDTVSAITLQTPKRMLRILRSRGDQGKKFLFLSSFVYMTANSLQGTPFTPFLLAYHVGDNEAFAVSLASVCVQMFAYFWMSQVTARLGVGRILAASIATRAVLFALTALLALFLSGSGLFVAALAWNAFNGFSWATWNSTVNVVFFSSMGPEKRGGVLGGFSALNNFGAVIGALFSGYISYYLGYATDFGTSGVLMVVSFILLRSSLRGAGIRDGLSTI